MLPSGGLFLLSSCTSEQVCKKGLGPRLNSALSSPTSEQVCKKGGGGGGKVGSLGNQLLITDHGLTGFPDLKVNPGLEKILLVLFQFT